MNNEAVDSFNAALAEGVCRSILDYNRSLEEIERGDFQITEQARNNTQGLLLLVLSLEKYGSQIKNNTPLVLRPLARSLIEVMLIFSLIQKQSQIPADIIEGPGLAVSLEAKQFLLDWGGDAAKNAVG